MALKLYHTREDGKTFCPKCNEFFDNDHFTIVQTSLKTNPRTMGAQFICKKNDKRRSLDWVNRKYSKFSENSVEQQKHTTLMGVYGIGMPEYNKMFAEQEGCCYICKRHQSELPKSLCVDHDHSSPKGEVRGLLCHDCNRGLGDFKDNLILLKKAVEYLERGSRSFDIKNNHI